MKKPALLLLLLAAAPALRAQEPPRIVDTDTLLDLAEKRLGRDHRRWIEQRLKA